MTDYSDFEPFSAAERKILLEADQPSRLTVGDGERPEGQADDNHIRAEVLRRLLLDRNGRLHDKGLRLRGAWISGVLDLQGANCDQDITLTNCHLCEPMALVNAQLRGLHLSGTSLSGISADNAQFRGSVYLRGGSDVRGEISLASVRIDGDLQVCDVTLRPREQDAIFAPSLRVGGSLFLGNYPYSSGETALISDGTLFFSSARIEHDCFVTSVSVSLVREGVATGYFGATEEHGANVALSLARAQIGGILYFKDSQISGEGIVNLAGASVARLRDEPSGPGANYPIRLDGFRYGDFSRHSNVSVGARLDWLERRPPDTPFTAQPYEQLADVLGRLGHRGDVRKVYMRKERLLRAENRAMLFEESGFGPRWLGSWLVDHILRVSVGYGYHPGRSVFYAVMLIFVLGLFFDQAWKAGDMTPNAAPILISAEWIEAVERHPENPAAAWSAIGAAGQDWETFNAYAYAADLVVPLVALGQESAWAPSTSRSWWGRQGWWMRWMAKGLGWVITALGAAALTGVIRRD